MVLQDLFASAEVSRALLAGTPHATSARHTGYSVLSRQARAPVHGHAHAAAAAAALLAQRAGYSRARPVSQRIASVGAARVSQIRVLRLGTHLELGVEILS